VYVLSKRLKAKIVKRRGRLVCFKCGEELKVGDVVVSRVSGSKRRKFRVFYHKACYDSLFY